MLSKQAIQDFQKIYQQEFHKEISSQEAEAMGIRLLHIFKLILQPIPKKWVEEKLKNVKEVNTNGNK